jgi:hypothetical protein
MHRLPVALHRSRLPASVILIGEPRIGYCAN